MRRTLRLRSLSLHWSGIIITQHIREGRPDIHHSLPLYAIDAAPHQLILLSALGIRHDRMLRSL